MISENNKLLAKFMNKQINRFEGLSKIETILKYHEDWNWLIEVVEKIEGLRDGNCLMDNDDIMAYVTIESQYCEIRVYECIFEPEKEFTTKLEAVYSTCVQFVKWYNSKPELHT